MLGRLFKPAGLKAAGNIWDVPWSSTGTGREESIPVDFDHYVSQVYKDNGIVAACIQARMLPFSEARFMFQEMAEWRPGRLYGGPGLGKLDRPWQNATTGDMLSRMEQDASIAGNYFMTITSAGRLRRLRPSWVKIITGVPGDPDAGWDEVDAEVLGYMYAPSGTGRRVEPMLITPDRMVHYAPLPDPDAQWRGMSWLTPVIREVQSDTAATKHKLSYFKRGTAINMAIKYDHTVNVEQLTRLKQFFDENYGGSDKAFQTLHIGGGADPVVLGHDLKSIDFKQVQGAGETRIAAAAGVGAIIARFSEGMAGSSLNTGNYSAAKRQFADMTLRPLWRNAAGSLAKPAFVQVPDLARLWYDTRDVEFLKEDRKDAAEIASTEAQTIRALIDAGYNPDAVIDAVAAGDFSRLEGKHSGMYSVQLQLPGMSGSEGART